jgi:uncharacterized membrane protein YdjX (TVP38/TMEM64 family)
MLSKKLVMKQNYDTWLLLLACTGFTLIIILFMAKNFDLVERLVRESGIIGPLVMIALYGVLSFTPIPTDTLSVINGAVFGPIAGIFISWVGNNVAAIIEYEIGLKLSRYKNSNFVKTNSILSKMDKVPVHSVWFLILGRSIPQLGSKIVSFAAGFYEVPLNTYIWTSLIANTLGSATFALGGYGLLKLFSVN